MRQPRCEFGPAAGMAVGASRRGGVHGGGGGHGEMRPRCELRLAAGMAGCGGIDDGHGGARPTSLVGRKERGCGQIAKRGAETKMAHEWQGTANQTMRMGK